MPDGERWRPSICRRCKTPGDDENPISSRGLCFDCAITAVRKANTSMQQRSGPHWERWEASMLDWLRRLENAP